MNRNGTDAAIYRTHLQLKLRKYTHMNEHSALAVMVITLTIGITLLGNYGCSKVEERTKHQITSSVLESELKTQIVIKEKDVQLQCLKMKFKPRECGIK